MTEPSKNMFHNLLNKEFFPDQMKIAWVTLVFKAGAESRPLVIQQYKFFQVSPKF